MPDGRTVHRVTLTGDGLTARILTFGAVVQDLRLDGHPPPLVLGFAGFPPYLDRSPYFGAIVGRCANRIAGGRFTIDGIIHAVDRNERGRTCLHGGADGISQRLWTLAELGGDFVTLSLRDPDGAMGFPGTLSIACTYRLRGAALEVTLTAETDAPTPCNLAHHSYFNLDDGGRSTILDHRLALFAEAVLPVDGHSIPTGAILPVAGTPFDFRAMRPIRRPGDRAAAYDHNWCLAAERRAPTLAARLEAARSGLAMELTTTEPGLQFYAGLSVGRSDPGLDGIVYADTAGLCLEPQVWPDAVNQPAFPSPLLRPGESYRQETAYRFFR